MRKVECQIYKKGDYKRVMNSKFLLAVSRMTDEELLEYLIGEVEIRATILYQYDTILSDEDWERVDERTERIEVIKGEILRRM
jgi:hypothetical protein